MLRLFAASAGRDASGLGRSAEREAQARRVRGLILCGAFLAVLSATLFIATKPYGPLLHEPQRKAASKDNNNDRDADIGRWVKYVAQPSAGVVIRELPDGLSCTYVPFDNTDQWFGEPSTSVCESVLRKQRQTTGKDFSWGR
jgi:hypothetical protein